MGKHWRATSIGVVCLAGLALAAPWAVSSAPTDRPPRVFGEFPRIDLPEIRLGFSEPTVEAARNQLSDEPAPPARSAIEAAKVPVELPGAGVAATPFPKFDPTNPKAYDNAIDALYPPLPPAGVVMPFELGPDGRPMSLADLQRLAETHSPLIRQAAVEMPMPATAGFCNLEAVFIARQRHAKAIAAAERELARLALAQVEAEVLAGVRRGYFAVLAAQESMRVQEAFARFTDDAYRVQVERVKGGQAAVSTPLALRALAYQSRAKLVQSRNRYLSAWKQLAATVGRLDLHSALLDGRIDRPLPILSFESVHEHVMTRNSEVAAADYSLDKAQSTLRNCKLMPFAFFNRTSVTKARVELVRAEEEPARVRAALTAQTAEAFERYDNQRRILTYYRDNIIPDQALAYRAAATRPSPGADRANALEAVVAQQALAASVTTYVKTLGDAWIAVVDLGKAMQARDLFSDCGGTCGSQVACLIELPSCRVGTAAMDWPDVMPSASDQRIPAGSKLAPCLPPLSGDGAWTAPGAVSRVEPQPVSGSALVIPYGSIERSTKRRKFFGWPLRRIEGDAPLTLPQTEEPERCCPATEAAPQSLPQPSKGPELPNRLPDGPLKKLDTSAPGLPSPTPLPQIIEGPTEEKHRGRRAVVEPGKEIIPAVAIFEGSGPPSGTIAIRPTDFPAPETIYFRLPLALPPAPQTVPALRLPSLKTAGERS